ncbi:MAG: aminotransferase class V-fold PLP-dependent enzyme [Spirochaetes bacterium]|nr:aminotransferase class V-fold PLP-dependent enzyme [Spirochaetota bacterium]
MKTDSFWGYVKRNILGNDASIETPYGSRRITYADYTASGRGLGFIEEYMKRILDLYANTHTEDDETGRVCTSRLHQAEEAIKRLVNAGGHYKIIETGTGATGAIHLLQKILGLYIPPAATVMFRGMLSDFFDEKEGERFEEYILSRRPAVFVGPFEHHSNIVSWRECFAEVIEIGLDSEGLIDLGDLERKIGKKEYADRLKIGSFSAASNVTGVRSPVYDIARLLHRAGAYAFFDFAAIAPYVQIDMMKDDEAYFDGIFFSPHKFLGGPGSSGILVIHEKIYRCDVPPTTGGGGTVEYVSSYTQDYVPDIEVREKPGTPGILQVMRSALAMEVARKLGYDAIERREQTLIRRAFAALQDHRIEIVGNKDPAKRIAILSFNVKRKEAYLHPRFVTKLMNDLFGIQSRAGCLCAGPYGHRLLHIDREQSEKYRELIHQGFVGLKPGWTRLNFHYLISDDECDYICDAVRFITNNGVYFLPLYDFDMRTGTWTYRNETGKEPPFGIEHALDAADGTVEKKAEREVPYDRYLSEAEEIASRLKSSFLEERLATTDRALVPFLYYT